MRFAVHNSVTENFKIKKMKDLIVFSDKEMELLDSDIDLSLVLGGYGPVSPINPSNCTINVNTGCNVCGKPIN